MKKIKAIVPICEDGRKKVHEEYYIVDGVITHSFFESAKMACEAWEDPDDVDDVDERVSELEAYRRGIVAFVAYPLSLELSERELHDLA